MVTDGYINQKAVGYINNQINILSGIVLLTLGISLIFLFKFMYDLLDYLPIASMVTLLAVVVWLTVVGLVIVRRTSRRAVENLIEYTGKLNSLVSLQKDVSEIRHADILLERVLACAKDITMSDYGAIVGVNGQSGIDASAGERKPSGKFAEMRCPLRTASDSGGERIMLLRRGERKGVDDYSVEEFEIVSFITEFASKSLDSIMGMERMKAYEIHITAILVSAMECRTDKKGHSGRVANYALTLANRLGMPESRRSLLHRAALLHDIGYLKLPAQCFSNESYVRHAELGYDMLGVIDFYQGVAPIVLHHHERYDGSGYPAGLSGESIPLESRIISIAEAFDAIIAGKAYGDYGTPGAAVGRHRMMAVAEAMNTLTRYSGSRFDPHLVREFELAIEPDRVVELYENSQLTR